MIRVKLIATALALTILVALAGTATAQTFNTQERTFMTFNLPVELPGLVLQPGTYIFQLADTGSRNVVEVWSIRGKHQHRRLGHWAFLQADRREMVYDTLVMFKETRAGATPAVQYWFFPGEAVGKEFLYPKDQAERIAARTGAEVRTSTGTVRAAASQPGDTERN